MTGADKFGELIFEKRHGGRYVVYDFECTFVGYVQRDGNKWFGKGDCGDTSYHVRYQKTRRKAGQLLSVMHDAARKVLRHDSGT